MLNEFTPVRMTRFALRNVLRHRRRTLLTVTIIWFCFVALSVFQGYIRSTRESWGELLIRNEFGHLQVFQKGYLDGDESSFDHMISKADSDHVQDVLRRDPRVQFAAPRVKLSGLVGNNKVSRVFVGSARMPTELDGMYLSNPVQLGEFITDEVPSGIVLGKKLAEKLQVKIGDEVLLMSSSKLGSIEAARGKILGLSRTGNDQWDSMSSTMRLTDAADFLLTDEVHAIVILLKDGANTQQVRADLEKRFRDEHLPLVVRDFKENAKFFVQIVGMYSNYFKIAFGVLGVVVFISISNTMYMAITDRTREFATMKTLGLSRWLIFLLLLLEGFLIGSFAIMLGMGASYGIHAMINSSGFTLPPPPGGEDRLPFMVIFNLGDCLLLSVIFCAVATLSSAPPAWYVVRAEILKGLRSV
jgi:putative ABC transport system permease protein